MSVGVLNSEGKPINLGQLQAELAGGGIEVPGGLGMDSGWIYTYAEGAPADFPSEQESAIDSAIMAHTAMREKTPVELATEFQDPNTTTVRKQEIRDIQNGLLPPEMVPM